MPAEDEFSSTQNVIGGSYRLLERIASGTYGTVYKAKHIVFANRPIVALKLLHLPLPTQVERDQFFEEARLLDRLGHPYILHVLEAGIHQSTPYLITEYAAGGSLLDRIRARGGNPFSPAEALPWLSQIAQALHFAHQLHIVHRDLKPENILFNAQDEALVADFGIAVTMNGGGTQRVGMGGTYAYMAPEQFEGYVSPKNDQYALACIAYELLTGHRLFTIPTPSGQAWQYHHMTMQPTPPRQHNPALTPQSEQVLLKALSKQRDTRYTDITAFIGELRASLATRHAYPTRLSTEHTPTLPAAFAPTLPASQAPTIPPQNMPLVAPTMMAPVSAEAREQAKEYYRQGNALAEEGRYVEAIQAFDQALRLNPDSVAAHNNKGNALIDLGRYAEAIQAFDQALRVNPQHSIAHFNKGNAYSKLDLYKEAINAYNASLSIKPTEYAYNSKGWMLHRLGRDEEALEALDKALEIDSECVLAYNNKSVVLHTLERYEEALECSEQALRLNPRLTWAYTNKSDALTALKRYEEALAVNEQRLRIEPDNAETHIKKGQLLEALERPEEALAAFEQAIHHDPKSFDACNHKLQVLKTLKRFEEMVVTCDMALHIQPENVAIYHLKALVLGALRRYSEALEASDRARKLAPNDEKIQATHTQITQICARLAEQYAQQDNVP